MIFAEAMHNARVIRLNGTHLPAGIRQWLGDSIADDPDIWTTGGTAEVLFRSSDVRARKQRIAGCTQPFAIMSLLSGFSECI